VVEALISIKFIFKGESMSISSSPRFDVTTLGEVMLRLSVPIGHRLEDVSSLDVHPGGAEANVCASLTALGRRCAWVSRLPDNPLGKMIVRRLRAAGIDTAGVVYAENARVGTYYVEFATPPRPIQVVYDRADSAAAAMSSADVDWDYLLDTRVLHLTGITPALSDSCRELVQEAITRAKQAGVAVSFDINYRAKLWSPTKAAETLRAFIADVDLLICGRGDAQVVFGCSGEDDEILDGIRQLTTARQVVLTLSDAGAIAYDDQTRLQQSAIAAEVVDRLGAGDAFAAGVLDGWLVGSLADGLRQGTALGAIALSQVGDMANTTRAEVAAILDHAGGGIRR
jgi:2-dehydro-3-deoxygluconokinase